MESIKAHVYNLLDSIEGVDVHFYYPQTFITLPSISFYENATVDGASMDNLVWLKDCIIQIDVWAAKYTQADSISGQIDAVMHADGWRCQMMSDLPQTDGVYHRTMRYRKQILKKEGI